MYLSSCPVMGCSTALELMQPVGQTISRLKSAERKSTMRQDFGAATSSWRPQPPTSTRRACPPPKKTLDMYQLTSTLLIRMSNTERNRIFTFRLDLHSGVPVYRQIIDQVLGGIAAGTLTAGHQLPTVRQVG